MDETVALEQFGLRLKEAIGDEPINAFAKKCDIAESLLRGYLMGGTLPGLKKVIALANAASVNVAWLAAGVGPKTPEEAAKKVDAIRDAAARVAHAIHQYAHVDLIEPRIATKLLDQSYLEGKSTKELLEELNALAPPINCNHPDFVLVPRLDVRASMGPGAENPAEDMKGALQFRRTWLESRGIKPSAARIIDVVGDSMMSTLANGDMVLIDTNDCHVLIDAIYCLQLDGQLYVKRLQKVPGRLKIISENEQYEPIILETGDEASQRNLRIIGRMRWFGREV